MPNCAVVGFRTLRSSLLLLSLEDQKLRSFLWNQGLSRWFSGKESIWPVQETKETQVQSLGQEDPLEEKMAIALLFLLGKNSIFKSRDITLLTKVRLVKAMVFPVVMYGCESWTVKKAESRRIDAFELWYWRRLLRVPWTARRSNQSILKEINPGISLERMMLKLKLQYFGHLM